MRKIVSIILLLAWLGTLCGCKDLFLAGSGVEDPTQSTQSTSNDETEPPIPSTETHPIPTETEPIQQSTETIQPAEPPLLEPQLRDSDFVKVTDYIPEIVVDLKYATADNFTEQVIYDFHDAYLRYGTVKKLIAVSEVLAEHDVYLKIWDAFRPPAAQFKLWEVYPDPNFVSDPNVKYSSHSRGNTVDITLVDAQGNELEMPTGFDDFSSMADRVYSDCSATAAEYAILLQEIMEEHGFSGYQKEWWHFSDETEYLPEECFDPTVISTWYADCNEYINLRTEPNAASKSIARIPVNGEFTLLGWSGEFALVDYNGLRGYVAAGYIQPVGKLAAATIEWTPNCEEFISLRSIPGGTTVLAKIPVGEKIIFEKWCGKYALVSYKGTKGYVLANYIKPSSHTYFSDCLAVVEPTAKYSYEQMIEDVSQLQALYPDILTSSVIGTSELGKEIPVLLIGNPDVEHHVLIQGAMHGREHLTAWLSMAIADYSMSQHYFDSGTVCYHIIPMVNPDGVTISQSGVLDETQQIIYENDMDAGYTTVNSTAYAKEWKANAKGIDLNRNFPSGWDDSDRRASPSSEQYRGPKPFSAAESIALRDYTLKYDFDATISFHSSGNVIYYQYGDCQPINRQSQSLAQSVERTTGYTLEENDGTDGAGFKDWAIDELGIPSITIEIGCTTSPLPERELYNVFARFQTIVPTVNAWIMR